MKSRDFFRTAATATIPRSAHAQDGPAIEPGRIKATRESLIAYGVPDWFRDAKFRIWAHWGPESAPECGDWYARNMYIEGRRGKVKWTQDAGGVKVDMPPQNPCHRAVAFKVELA